MQLSDFGICYDFAAMTNSADTRTKYVLHRIVKSEKNPVIEKAQTIFLDGGFYYGVLYYMVNKVTKARIRINPSKKGISFVAEYVSTQVQDSRFNESDRKIFYIGWCYRKNAVKILNKIIERMDRGMEDCNGR